MKQLISVLLLLILPLVASQAATDKDLLTQMLEQMNSRPGTYPDSEYESITVSPEMMKSVVQMISDSDLTSQSPLPMKKEDLVKLVRNIKGLRILQIDTAASKYNTLLQKIISTNKTRYKELPAENLNKDSIRIWLRKSHNSIVEIILVNNSKSDELQIMDFTGQFSNEFIKMLKSI